MSLMYGWDGTNLVPLKVDNQGVLSSAGTSLGTWYASIGTSAGSNIKNSAGTVLACRCVNLNSTIRYFQLFNSISAPTGTPALSLPVYGGSGLLCLDRDAFPNGRSLTTGITWGFSTTATTYTAGAAADAIVEICYL